MTMLNMEGRELGLAEILRIAIETRLATLHTCIPGQIVSYEKSTNLATVQVQIRQFFPPEEIEEDTAELLDVVVQWPSVGPDSFLTFPLVAGTYGLIHFNERATGNWLMNGGDNTPEDHRRFTLSDAWFVPGGAPVGKMPSADPDNIVLHNGKAEMILTPDGKFSMTGASGEELVTILNDLITQLLSAKVITAIGPQPFTVDTVAQITEIQNRLALIKA